jgi:hypothetical protein
MNRNQPFGSLMGLLLLGLLGCGSPSPEDLVRQQIWTGELLRLADDQPLSPIQLRFVGADTVLIYANALYGAGRDTLRLARLSLADSTLHAQNDTQQLIRRLYYAEPDSGQTQAPLVFVGPDHYAQLWPDTAADRSRPPSFYRHQPVPLEARKYLHGTWVGEVEMNDPAHAFWIQLLFGGVKQRLVFHEGQQVEVNLHMGWFGTEGHGTHPYTWAGDSLVIHTKDKPAVFGLSTDGRKLCLQADKITLCLRPQ